MNFIKTPIEGVQIVEPVLFKDERGYFFESYNEAEFIKNGITTRFVQDNQSKSSFGVVRGLHAQTGAAAQAKLVRVLQGCVLDVAVDIRRGSPTFGRHVAVELSDANQRQLFLPRGCLHGFSVLSPVAILAYKCDNFYCKAAEMTIRYDDADLNINWKIDPGQIIISAKDAQAKSFKECDLYEA